MIAQLRPYQLDAITLIRHAISKDGGGHRRILLQLPTGAGKTLTAAAMLAGALDKGSRSLFAAHRLELIDQTVSTFARLGILSIGVIRATDRRRDASQPIQVASIQTLARRSTPEGIRIVFIDEAHRSCSPTYVKHIFEAFPDAVIVGLSATPCRTDGKPLGRWYTKLIQGSEFGATYSELIAQGHLVAPLVYSLPLLADMTTVRTTAGDYNAEDLEKAVNTSALVGDVVREWKARGGDRRTVVFAVSVAHSKHLVEQFTGAGISAEHLDGTTPEDLRRAILARLASGETRVVCNVGVLCEGWDLPACKCLVLARPTKSLALYMQMAGRILRPWEGVEPIILDHGGNVDRVVNGEKMGLPHQDRVWSLESRPKRVGVRPVATCKACFAVYEPSLKACPRCGVERPAGQAMADPAPAKEDLTHVELVLRGLEKLGDADADPKLRDFRRLAKMASERGWRPGAVNHRFRELHGDLLPMAWWRALKRQYRADAEWTEAVVRKSGSLEPDRSMYRSPDPEPAQ